MQNAGLQYVEGVTPVPESPFGVAQMQNNSPSSSTSSLRQFRKKDNVDKSPGATGAHSASTSRTDSLNSSHVARVAPHNHYPHKQNEYFRYPQYQEYSSPYKEHTVKYSEIAEPVSQAIPHLEHLPPSVVSKHKEKDFPEMCNIPQQSHLNKSFSDHQFNGQQGYPTEMALHHQYMQKEPQGSQMVSPYKPESQYIPKDGAFNHQISPFLKYNIPTQSRNYGHLENPSLGSFQRMDSHIARSLMSDHPHIRDFPADYGAMEQGRMYTQKQRYYPAPLPPSNPTYSPNYPHRNIPAQQYNYPNCNYPRNAQVNSSMGRYPINMERSMSPRRPYSENLDIGMNYPSVPQKISSAYPNYPAYAQHYQHRRPSVVPQEYYHHQQHSHTRSHPQYMPTHHPQEVSENHVASNNIRQYWENWAEEESTTEITPQVDNSKYIQRINRDETNEVYVINASELPQYLENGVPLVTSENGQYIFKSNVSIDNTGAIKILEKTVENTVLPSDAQERVVSLHIIENPKADCLINTRTTNINKEHPGSANQVPAATINVITTNTNHSNQEPTVHQSYNATTSAFNTNRMNLMHHHIPPINHSAPKHNQNYEHSVDLCLNTTNMPGENNNSQQAVMSISSSSSDNTNRLSPQVQHVEKSSELSQQLENSTVSDGSSLDKNRLKIQVLSYQEVPQNSCIVMPSTQSRLNFDESLLPNQVPSDVKGTKNDFEIRTDHVEEVATISNVIPSSDNILNEAHEELDKIVEDTLTSSNINIPLVNCERNHLPKIQEKCENAIIIANSRIPDDLNLDLESNIKDSNHSSSDYTIDNNCNNGNEDIMDLSTSRRGSKNDNNEEQSSKLSLSISNVHNKLEQIVQEAHDDIAIINEYSTSNECVSVNNNSEKQDGVLSPKSSMKHMPLIEDNLETKPSVAPSESLASLSDVIDEDKNSADTDKCIVDFKDGDNGTKNYSQEKKGNEEIDISHLSEITKTQSQISNTNIEENLPHLETKQDGIINSLDTSLEAKLSEIVGEAYELSEQPSNVDYSAEKETEVAQKTDNFEEIGYNKKSIEKITEIDSHDMNINSSTEISKNAHDQLIEEPDEVLSGEHSPMDNSVNENLSQAISEDSRAEKKKEGCRKRRIFSVDDIIYRIGPTAVQSRRDSIHSIPEGDYTPDIFLEACKPQEHSQEISNEHLKKEIEHAISLDSTEKILRSPKKESEYATTSENKEVELKYVEGIDCRTDMQKKLLDNLLSPTISNNSRTLCSENINKGNTIINISTDHQELGNLEAAVLMGNVKHLESSKMIANISQVDNFEESCDKFHVSPQENRDTESTQNATSVKSLKSHILADEKIISVDRTCEFVYLTKSNCGKLELVDKDKSETINMMIEELPLLATSPSEELETSIIQQDKGNFAKGTNTEHDIGEPETIANKNNMSIDDGKLFSSGYSDVKEVDNSGMDISEIVVESCCEGPAILSSTRPNEKVEDQAETVCSKSVENSKWTTEEESDSNLKAKEYKNFSNKENITEKSIESANQLSGCRFSVIHKIDDSKRITHQEEIRIGENCEADISKVTNTKSTLSKTEELKSSERKTDPLSSENAMFLEEDVSKEIITHSVATTLNHCSVIQSIEYTMQDDLMEQCIETIESENEEINGMRSKAHEDKTSNVEVASIKDRENDDISTEYDSSLCNGSTVIENIECNKEISKKGEQTKSSNFSKKEELTFEQKFVEPFCNKIEENMEKTEDIEEKSTEEVQYRSMLKIEENNVLLEIGGELVEIIVNQVNGKKVITVIPLSSTATVDFNDNYENVDRTQLNEGIDSPDVCQDVRSDEKVSSSPEDSRKDNSNIEKTSELTKIIRNSEDDLTTNECEFISSTLTQSVGEIFEDIILNENEIIIGDESLEEEINLDLQSRGVLEDEGTKMKPTLCTKAAKKLYDDIAIHIPNKSYSSLREFRRIKSKPESSIANCKKDANQSKGKRSSKRSIRVSSRKRCVSEKNECSQTALSELIERRKMRKEKIRLKYTQYVKLESKMIPELSESDSLINDKDTKIISTKSLNESKIERLPIGSEMKKVTTNADLKRKELKEKMHKFSEKSESKPVDRNNEMVEQDDLRFVKQKIVSSNVEIEKKKPEEKPTSTSVIVSSSISALDASAKNFQEAATSTAMEISKNLSTQDRAPKFPKISTPRDLSLTKNVNEHYLSRKDHSNLKKKLSIQEYNSRKRKSVGCKSTVPEKTVKPADEIPNASTNDLNEEVTRPSTIYSDKQFECFPNSFKDPRRRPHSQNVQSTKLQRTQSENFKKSQTQNISTSKLHKLSESFQLTNSKKHKDPLLNSQDVNVAEVQNHMNYKSLLLGKSSTDTYIPKSAKISSRRKTIEVMYDRKFETAEMTKKKVLFDDYVQINEINTTQTKTTSIKPETTNDCEVSSSCSDVVEDKTSNDCTDCLNVYTIGELNESSNNMSIKLDQGRKNDWEGSNSPKDSITDVFAAGFLEKTKLDSIQNKNKGKFIIDISDLDTNLIKNEPKDGFTNNTKFYEDASSLKDYKEAVDSKLNSLNIQIPKSTKTRIPNEDGVLIHKFLRKEQLNSDEIKQIRRIIYLKKKIQQMTHQNLNTKNENNSYEVKKNFESTTEKDLKLQLKKIDGRPKRKKRRFRNLYSDSPESSEGDVQGTAGEFSVYEGENMSGVKLIFRRKTDLMHLQPVVKLQRCKYIESMAKKLKFE